MLFIFRKHNCFRNTSEGFNNSMLNHPNIYNLKGNFHSREIFAFINVSWDTQEEKEFELTFQSQLSITTARKSQIPCFLYFQKSLICSVFIQPLLIFIIITKIRFIACVDFSQPRLRPPEKPTGNLIKIKNLQLT